MGTFTEHYILNEFFFLVPKPGFRVIVSIEARPTPKVIRQIVAGHGIILELSRYQKGPSN